MHVTLDLTRKNLNVEIVRPSQHELAYEVQIKADGVTVLNMGGEGFTLAFAFMRLQDEGMMHVLAVLHRMNNYVHQKTHIQRHVRPADVQRYACLPDLSALKADMQKHWCRISAGLYCYAETLSVRMTDDQYDRVLFQLALSEYLNPHIAALFVRSRYANTRGWSDERKMQQHFLKHWVYESALPDLGLCRNDPPLFAPRLKSKPGRKAKPDRKPAEQRKLF